MPVNYALKYADKVDERFKLGSLTAGLFGENGYDWIGVQTVRVFSRSLTTLNNYTASGTSRYGTPLDLENAYQEMTISQDKSFTYVIDRKTEQDTNGTMEAAATLAENIDNVLIPAVDTYRLGVLAAAAPASGTYTEANHTITAAADITSSNAYAAFLGAQEILDNDKAPAGGRVAVVSPAFFNLIKLDENFVKRGDMATQIAINGVVGEIDGVPIIKVPSIYLPAKVNFMITNPLAAVSPVKIQEFKIHDNAPGISGRLAA